jgi:ChrR Cupin-like domain
MSSAWPVRKRELEFQLPKRPWRTPDGSIAWGISEQILSADEEGRAYTRLLRFEPGADSSPNGPQVHDFWEEVFIIDGDITDLRLDERFTSGMYACRPPGMEHGPWRSKRGVLMIEFRYAIPADGTPSTPG